MNRSHGSILTVAMGSLALDSWPTLSSIHTDDYLTRWKKGQSLSTGGKVVGKFGSSWGDVCIETRDSFICEEVLLDSWSLRLASWAQARQRTINHQTQAAILEMSVQLGPRNHTPFSLSSRLVEWYLVSTFTEDVERYIVSTLTEHVTAPLSGRDWFIPINP